MKTILVIYGGQSVEHDISVITALQAMKNVKGYKVFPIYIKPDGIMVTADNLIDENIYLNYKKSVKNEKKVMFCVGEGEICVIKKNKIVTLIKPYSALLCTHGHGGEDGCLQGLLELSKIPYTSSSPLSCAVVMDKVFTKMILEKNKIHTPAYVHFNRCEYAQSKQKIIDMVKNKIGFPCIIKPANGGSSVGIGISTNENMLIDKIEDALNFDNKILVEKFIQNAKEFSCGVVKSGGKLFASRIWQVDKGEFFTFEEKYLKEEEGQNGELSKKLQEKIRALAMDCYEKLECGGVVRVDFLLDENNKLLVGEVNSIPGSLAFNLFPYPFADLISCLVEEGVIKMGENNKVEYSFSSSAIQKFIQFGGKRQKK